MTSKKITEMPIAQDLDGGDWLTGVDNSAAAADKNVKITKADLLAGLAVDADVSAVAGDLTAHEGTDAKTAHPNGVNATDLSDHAGGRNGAAAHITSAERTAWNAKVDDADLGNAAGLDVGTTAGTVAAGNAPADAVTGHESTYDHANLPTTAQKAGLAGNAGSGADPYAVESQLVTAHDALTGLTENDQHPGNAIYITGATAGNAVSVDAAGRLVDSGEPPGGTVESTRTKVSATDSYNGYLEEKIVAGADITVTKNGADASPQTLVIAYAGGSSTPVRRVEDMTAGGSVDIAVDGGAVTVNVDSGNAVTLTSSGSGQDDSAREYTASIDFIHGGTGGSVSVSIDAALEQMNESGAITVAVGVPVSAILRTRADGTVQLYRSTKA